MPTINVMDLVAKVMEREGVEVVFGVPGAAILPLHKALAKSTRIRHISVRDEEGGTHAADGYARATGKVGVNIGTSGPAGTNLISGLYAALADSIPMVCITGQVAAAGFHKDAAQAFNIIEIARPVTKWAVQVSATGQMPWVFRRAFRVAQECRAGPVLIDLPVDVQTGSPEVEWDPDWDRGLPLERPVPNPAAIRGGVAMLLRAERPMLMAGGGVIIADAYEELVELAEYLQIPVTPTYMGKGAIREDHPLCAGVVGTQTSQRYTNQLFSETDFVLAVGARFADRHTGELSLYRGQRTYVQVDIEPYQIGRVFPADLGIVSDAKLALEAMLDVARDMTPPRRPGSWTQRVSELRSTLPRTMDFDDVPISAQRVFREINEVYDQDTVFVTAIDLYRIFSGELQRTFKPRHYISCGRVGALGWVVPACIGAKLGAPDKLVVGVVGDDSFQFLIGKVAIAVQYRVPFVLVMLNDAYTGLVRQSEKYAQDEDFAVDLAYDWANGAVGIDHIEVMEAMGALGRRVTRPCEIAEALDWAIQATINHQVPVLVEIMTERDTAAASGVSIDSMHGYEPIDDLVPRS